MGIRADIDCLIISGFPGIGKTATYKEMKKCDILAKAIDMDVRNENTTNGIDVSDPADYVRRVVEHSKNNAIIFVTCDPVVRLKMREANLFYMLVAPEFPPEIANAVPGNFRPDTSVRLEYMKRFTGIGSNTKAGETLAGKGYEDCIRDMFGDSRPKCVMNTLNKITVDVMWRQLEAQTRNTLGNMNPQDIANLPVTSQ